MAADVTISGTRVDIADRSAVSVSQASMNVIAQSNSRVDIVSGIQQFGSPRPSSGFIYPRGLD